MAGLFQMFDGVDKPGRIHEKLVVGDLYAGTTMDAEGGISLGKATGGTDCIAMAVESAPLVLDGGHVRRVCNRHIPLVWPIPRRMDSFGLTIEVDCKAVKNLEIPNVRALGTHLAGKAVLASYGGGPYEGDTLSKQEVLHLD